MVKYSSQDSSKIKIELKKVSTYPSYFQLFYIFDTNINLSSQTTTTTHTIIKAQRTNHLKYSLITNYYHSSIITIHPTSPTSTILI